MYRDAGDSLAIMFLGFIAILIIGVVIAIGGGIAEAVTYEVVDEYVTDVTVEKTEAFKSDSGYKTYQVMVSDEDGNVYVENVSAEEYAFINEGDVLQFEIVKSKTCFGERTSTEYVH